MLALVLIYTTPKLSASDAEITAFYASSSTVLVTVGQFLIPFAGIAFLWHAHTTRLLIKLRTPSPSAIPYGLQLVSGILFVVLLFAGTASAGRGGAAEGSDEWALAIGGRRPRHARARLRHGLHLRNSRCGHVCADHHDSAPPSQIMPTWLAVVSYLLALFLLVSTTLHPVVVLTFPAWVVIAGLVVFIRAGRVAEPAASERQSA